MSQPSTSQPSADLLANAVDLAGLNRPAGDEPPGEFRVAIVGDHNGRPQVMLAFAHLQWIFEPARAADLAAVLASAAQQAAQLPTQPQSPSQGVSPGAMVEVPR
jgi:hypothetical protein